MERISMNKWLPAQSAEHSRRLPDRTSFAYDRASFVPAAWLNLLTTALLYLVFALVVVPVGLIRRWTGKDSLHLKDFKQNRTSVWEKRDHTYTAEDLQKPF
jgi:hypothetical protein